MQDDQRFANANVEQTADTLEESDFSLPEVLQIPRQGQRICGRCGENIAPTGFESCEQCRGARGSDKPVEMVEVSEEEYKAYFDSLPLCENCAIRHVSAPSQLFCSDCLRGQAHLQHLSISAQNSVTSTYVAKQGASTAGIAIAAAVVSWLVPFLGLALGYAARNEIRNSGGEKGGDGLATFAIVIGWLWVVFIVIYIAAASH